MNSSVKILVSLITFMFTIGIVLLISIGLSYTLIDNYFKGYITGLSLGYLISQWYNFVLEILED